LLLSRQEPVVAANRALDAQRDKQAAVEAERARARTPAAVWRSPSREYTAAPTPSNQFSKAKYLGSEKSGEVTALGKSLDKSLAHAITPHQTTTNHPKTPASPLLADNARRKPEKVAASDIDLLNQVEQPAILTWIQPEVWNDVLQLSVSWPVLAKLPNAIYMESLSYADGSAKGQVMS